MQVVLPPLLESLKVTVTPPKYTARPAVALPPGEGRIRGVVGTRVAFEARSNKPLESVHISIKGKNAGTATVLPDRQVFRGNFVLAEPGAYAYVFRLKDAEGIENVDPPRNEIEASADLVPDVTIDVPNADATVTADAQIPLTVSAKDDWGLREMRLRFHVGENADAHASTLTLASELPRDEHHRVSLVWPLSSLAVSEGMRIVFHAEATDWFDLGPQHVGKSPQRILTIISAKQKEAEIVSRQGDLLRLLERAEQAQNQTHDQTADLDVQLEKAGKLKPGDVDVLKRVQADQRRVNDVLASPADGAASAVRGLLEEMRQNHIASPETQQRLERFDRELAELGRSHLAAVDNHLTRAAKMAELPNPTQDAAIREEQSKALKGARHEQEIVLESLRSMLGNLAQWRDWQEVHEALRELVEGQEKLNGETGDLSRTTLAKPLSELGKQEQADLARLAERQTQLGEQVDRIGQRLREAAEALKSSNREAAQEAASTLKSLEKTDPQARMREIGGQLAQNNIGQAMARQHQLLDELRKLDRTFSQRPETDLKSLVGRLGDAGQRIESLRKDQEELRKRTEQLSQKKDAKNNDPQLETLRKEQNQLQEAAEETARELRRLGAETPSENMSQAGSHMSQAQEDLEQGHSSSAGNQQKNAVKELDRANAALKQSLRQASQKLAQQGLVRVADQLEGLAARQKAALDETKRLDTERTQAGRLTRGQLRSLQTVAGTQHQLHDETARLAEGLPNAEVYVWALHATAGRMQEAAERLGNQLTDAKTLHLENEAWSRLRDVVQTLKTDLAQEDPAANEEKEQSQEKANANGSEEIPVIAQLKLLKTIEQDLLRRTTELDLQRQEKNDASAKGVGDLDRLAAEQAELATLIRKMVSRQSGGADPGKKTPPSKGR